eukprot:TRINITY_DN18420_c0_g1_i1.p1 TRINITY_DN18420_c0_g1~~TRINITY_DN18420_c0_g1_i1.p1  ORF type:complete len:239 (+),score=33.11 TRINITY_DN18420_c0_g1_i1:43-759(+)
MVSHFTTRRLSTPVLRAHPVMEEFEDAASQLAVEEQRLTECEGKLTAKREELRRLNDEINKLERDRITISQLVAEKRKAVMNEVDVALTTRQQMVDNKSLLARIKSLECQLLEAESEVRKPVLGAEISEARRFNLEGVWVISTVENSPSRIAGLLPGDVIYEWNGSPISNRDDLKRALTASSPNEVVYVSVIRSDSDALSARSRKRIKVVLGGSPRVKPQSSKCVRISESPTRSPTVM